VTPTALCSGHRRIALDTNLFIYLFEDPGRRGDLAEQVLDAADAAGVRLIVSALSVGEVAVGPVLADDETQAERYADAIGSIPRLDIVPVSADLAVDATVLRGRHRLSMIDAIHLATARQAGATVLVTNDRRLPPLRDVEVVILDDLEPEGAPAEA
jgi:predicted nucleic acid-binding protein